MGNPKIVGGALAVVAVVTALLSFFSGKKENYQDGINRKEICAVCNKKLDNNRVTLQCKRHSVHPQCHQTLKNQGQSKCTVCSGSF